MRPGVDGFIKLTVPCARPYLPLLHAHTVPCRTPHVVTDLWEVSGTVPPMSNFFRPLEALAIPPFVG